MGRGGSWRTARLPKPGGETAAPDITTATGQRVLFGLLWDQHVAGLIGRYRASGFDSARPKMAGVSVPLRTDADLVQVLQWIRCYEYQSSAGASWPASFSRQYCALLSRRTIDSLIDRNRPTWVFERAGVR